MAYVDFGTFPQALAVDTKRVKEDGKPTQATLDNEFFLHRWVQDNTQALDEAVIEVEGDVTEALALGNQATASGRIRLVAGGSAPAGVAVRFSVELEITAGSNTWAATGLYLDLLLDGTGRFVIIADQFTLIDPDYSSGTATQVFNYIGGVFRFNVPVILDTGEIAGNAVTSTAANTGSIASSALSVSKSFYGGTDALVIVTLEPTSGIAPGAATAFAITQRTYTVTMDGVSIGTIKAYDTVVGANSATVRNAADIGSETVVGGLYTYPQGGAKQFMVTGVSAGSRTFAVTDTSGLSMDAAISVIEFKR